MAGAVRAAWDLCAADPDTPDAVLLAPAAASLDMFAGYGARGDSFAAAARALPGASTAGVS
jgi:UDP-N-acetylmuramoylalanine--D-glutamate ligase